MDTKSKLSLISAIFITIFIVFMSLQCSFTGEAPSIKLEIYDGPNFKESENKCYYRVEAIIVSGEPDPEIKFSTDNNVKTIGSDRVEAAVDVGDSYTLTATAINLAGTATASITLLGECGKEIASTTEAEEEVITSTTKTTEEEISTTEASEEVESTTPTSAPTIDIMIYDGPTYSPEDSVCYYRVKATVTGNPSPTIEWNRDDSHGAWGAKKVQINLNSLTDTYTLTATATNAAGSDTDSIVLTWGCEAPVPTEQTVNLNPFISGTVGPTPVEVTTAWIGIGDSLANTDWRGLFAFDVSSLAGKELVSAKLRLSDPLNYGTCNFKGPILIWYYDFLPGVDAADYSGTPYAGPQIFSWNVEPLEFSTDFLKEKVAERASSGVKLQFGICYQNPAATATPGVADGRQYDASDIILTVKYLE